MTAAEFARLTPADRDRYIDLLRVASLGAVIVGHWLMAVVVLSPDGGVAAGNALVAIPWAAPATWLLQVMPVFFLVGGAAHWHALRSLDRRGGRYPDFVRARVGRLLAPTAVFVVVWTAVAVAVWMVELHGTVEYVLSIALRVVAQPLWFLAVYLGVVASAWPMRRLHERFGTAVPLVMAGSVLAVDVLRLGLGLSYVGPANYALVWLACHQMGFLYAEGTLRNAGARLGWGVVAIGLGVLLVLTTIGPYPVSMVGLPGAQLSNMNPPSAALLAQATMLIGLVIALRRPATRWLERPRVWAAVASTNAVAMTTFLWHLTALFLVVAVLVLVGVGTPEAGTWVWWVSRPAWLAGLAVVTCVLVMLFRGFESSRARREHPGVPDGRPIWPSVTGMALVVVGVLGYAVHGFALSGGRPLRLLFIELGAIGSGLVMAGGWALVTRFGRRRRRQ